MQAPVTTDEIIGVHEYVKRKNILKELKFYKRKKSACERGLCKQCNKNTSIGPHVYE